MALWIRREVYLGRGGDLHAAPTRTRLQGEGLGSAIVTLLPGFLLPRDYLLRAWGMSPPQAETSGAALKGV
jgi:hypothetical protein